MRSGPEPLRAWSAALLAALCLAGVGAAAGQEPDQPPAPAVGEAASAEPADGEVTAPPAETQTPAAPEEPPPAEYITFDFPFPPEKGGGTLTGSAGDVQFERRDLLRLSRGVELRYRDLKIQADHMVVDLNTKIATAEGEVILDQGPRRLTGATLVFDLEAKTGELTDASAYVDPDFYFSGKTIAKTGDDTYSVHKGVFTSCTDEVPDWSFRVSSANLRVDGFARARNTRMRLKKVPLLYMPYLAWPTQSNRSSGLLVPNLGYSQRRGAYLGLAYYQVLGRSYDTTLYADLYGKDYYGAGTEFRYTPSETTKGILQGYAIRDPLDDNRWRWRVNWNHTSDALPWGLRGVVSYLDYSDFEFFRDFERDFNDITLRSVYASAYVSGNWGAHSLNVLVDDRRTLLTNVVEQRQLPEVEYRLRPTRLGPAPIYLELISSAAYQSLNRTETLQSDYGRVDFFPQLTVPLSAFPWLSLSLSAGGRATWWQDSLDEKGRGFTGQSLTRVLPVASAQVVGPSFSRIFAGKVGSFGKFKHIVEPRWGYAYVDQFQDQTQIPLFDEVDRVNGLNLGSVALVNRLLAKPQDESTGDTREILSFEVSQLYSFDQNQPLERSRDGSMTSQRSPIDSRLRFYPSDRLRIETQAGYSTLFKNLTATSLSGSYARGGSNVGVTWFTRYNAESGDAKSDQIRLSASLGLVPSRLQLDAQLNYDLKLSLFQQQRYVLSYNSQCYALRLEFRDLELGSRTDRDYRFSLSLKNVGTFLDLTGGTSSYR